MVRSANVDPQWSIFYVVRNGIRYLGMPSSRHTPSERDMWSVTDFVSRIETQPPGVRDYWTRPYGQGVTSKTHSRQGPSTNA